MSDAMTPFPTECPVCGADLRVSSEATPEEYAEYEYECGLILQRWESGNLHADFVCQWATREAIDGLNFMAKHAALSSAGEKRTAGDPFGDDAVTSGHRTGES